MKSLEKVCLGLSRRELCLRFSLEALGVLAEGLPRVLSGGLCLLLSE